MSLVLRVTREDITTLRADAIVNAANSALAGGGGVDGAIHRAGGNVIYDECRKIREEKGGCPTGDAVVTRGGNLPAKYVIHAVGPVWHGGGRDEERLLAAAYTNSLKRAAELKLATVAFPNISTGIYGFPKRLAAETAVKAVRAFAKKPGTVKEVIFACFDPENEDVYRELLEEPG